MDWYKSLKKSPLTPPSYVFGIVWPVLYFLILISFITYIPHSTTMGFVFFGIQLLLNLSWSPVFFRYKNPQLALGIVSLMWIFILLTILTFYKTSKLSAYLLIPYFIWVSFATYLNWYITST